MDKRHDCQQILGVGLAHFPVDAGLMCSRVSEHAEDAFDEVRKPTLLALLARRPPRVDRDHGRITAKRAINQHTAIVGQAGLVSYLVANAFHGFLDGVEVVVREKLSPAECEHVGMHAAAFQVGPQSRARRCASGNVLAVAADPKAPVSSTTNPAKASA